MDEAHFYYFDSEGIAKVLPYGIGDITRLQIPDGTPLFLFNGGVLKREGLGLVDDHYLPLINEANQE